MSTNANEKRIARNTIFLYFRIFISICLSLYTSRVMLEVLGVRDYGVYNVVGGLVIILSFLNGTMSGATQRFLNFEMGRGMSGKLSETFAAAWVIHLVIAGIVFLLGESVGLWFVNNFLVIAPDRMIAANWVYQFSLIGGILTVLMVPFTGAVFAHEKMNVYAYISLGFSVMKLVVILLLLFVSAVDNLIIYAGLMMLVSAIHFLCFFIYGLKKFPECRLRLNAPKDTIKTMLRYSGSDLVGTSCYTIENQGVLVILNRVGGTALNAVGGLTATVTLTIAQFGSSLIMAFRPQIIKQYAARQYSVMQRLLVNCSRYAILLLALIAIPAFVEMDFILGVWLKEVPPFTAEFCRITLLASMSQMAVTTLACGIHATGKILSYSVITGLTYIVMLPIMYCLIIITGYPAWVYILPIIQLTINVVVIAVMLHNRVPEFRIWDFLSRGFLAPTVLTVICTTIAFLPTLNMHEGWCRFICVGLISTALLFASSWFLLFDNDVRQEIIEKIREKLHV